MTVNNGFSGFKYFSVLIFTTVEHEGSEAAVFTRRRNGQQVGMSVIKYDLDITNFAGAGFNVLPGDVIKTYVADNLSNNPVTTPVLFKTERLLK
jgi:hypothetical protein